MIFLDHAATTPMSENAMNSYMKANQDYFANTSSLHELGEKSKILLHSCRESIATIIHAKTNEIYFTSGGTEANQRTLQALFEANSHKGNHVITTKVEHPSVHSFFKTLECNGVDVTYLPVDQDGLIQISQLEQALRPDTILASVQHVNSEIGAIQPLAKIGSLLSEKNVLFHSDCVQSFGKIPIDVGAFHLDAISISSHKIYGPKGVGAVFLRAGASWKPLNPLTTHENGFRPGTLNTPGIAAFTSASLDMNENMTNNYHRLEDLKRVFFDELSDISGIIHVEGNQDHTSPYIIGMSIYGLEGQYVMLTLDRHNICISTGSACQTGKQTASETMQALKKSPQEAKRFFRLSPGIDTTKDDMIKAAKLIRNCWKEKEGIMRVN
ncbi:IscS subfamily cysteine desulfurase [Evansella halocellulosilytica]|uniref:IscS subfamily cysteine desulfurase n=1 Tax=Evansella halocellulosilytica TaxID=2011013 RepID=UPI000BB71F38|nr:IscS subfamily cysteine desulfurase [Evansella halocellulosilytica]